MSFHLSVKSYAEAAVDSVVLKTHTVTTPEQCETEQVLHEQMY